MDITSFIKIQNYLEENNQIGRITPTGFYKAYRQGHKNVLERQPIDLIKAYCLRLKGADGKNKPLAINDNQAIILLAYIATEPTTPIFDPDLLYNTTIKIFFENTAATPTFDSITSLLDTTDFETPLINEVKQKLNFGEYLKALDKNNPSLFFLSIERLDIFNIVNNYLTTQCPTLEPKSREFTAKNYTQIIYDQLFKDYKEKAFQHLDGLNPPILPGDLFDANTLLPNEKHARLNREVFTQNIIAELVKGAITGRFAEEIAEQYVQREIKKQIDRNANAATIQVPAGKEVDDIPLARKIFNSIDAHLKANDKAILGQSFITGTLYPLDVNNQKFIDDIINAYLKHFVKQEYKKKIKAATVANATAGPNARTELEIIEDVIGDLITKFPTRERELIEQDIGFKGRINTPKQKYILPILKSHYAPIKGNQSRKDKIEIRKKITEEISDELRYLSLDEQNAQELAEEYTNHVIKTQDKVREASFTAKAIIETLYAQYAKTDDKFDKNRLQEALDFLKSVQDPTGALKSNIKKINNIYFRIDMFAYQMANNRVNLNDLDKNALAQKIKDSFAQAQLLIPQTVALIPSTAGSDPKAFLPADVTDAKIISSTFTTQSVDGAADAEKDAELSRSNLDKNNAYYYNQQDVQARRKHIETLEAEAKVRETEAAAKRLKWLQYGLIKYLDNNKWITVGGKSEEDTLIQANQTATSADKNNRDKIQAVDEKNQKLLNKLTELRQKKIKAIAWWIVRLWGIIVAGQTTYMVVLTALDYRGISLFATVAGGMPLWMPLLITLAVTLPVWAVVNLVIDKVLDKDKYSAKTRGNYKLGFFMAVAVVFLLLGYLSPIIFATNLFFLVPAAIGMIMLGASYLVNRLLSESSLEKGWIYLLATQDKKGIMRFWQGFIDEYKFTARELWWFKKSFYANFILASLYGMLVIKVIFAAAGYGTLALILGLFAGGPAAAATASVMLVVALAAAAIVMFGYITLTGSPLAGFVKLISNRIQTTRSFGVGQFLKRTWFDTTSFTSKLYKEAREYRIKSTDSGLTYGLKVFWKYTKTTLATILFPVLLIGGLTGMSVLLTKSAASFMGMFITTEKVVAGQSVAYWAGFPLAVVGMGTKGALIMRSAIGTAATLATKATQGLSEKPERQVNSFSPLSLIKQLILWFSALNLNPFANATLNAYDINSGDDSDDEPAVPDNDQDFSSNGLTLYDDEGNPEVLAWMGMLGAAGQSASFSDTVVKTAENNMSAEKAREDKKANGKATNTPYTLIHDMQKQDSKKKYGGNYHTGIPLYNITNKSVKAK